jgi:leucine dehydrogenase
MWPYTSEDEAIADVLRLSEGMTYKSAVAETGLGGGKAVIIGDPNKDKSPELFRAMGRFLEALDGKYITAEDMNIGIPDLEIVREETKWVTGLSIEKGSSGNPSPYTALGCLIGLRAVVEEYGADSLKDQHVLIQGVGAVGGRLAVLLKEAGARVTICDINAARVAELCEEHGFEAVSELEHLAVECDIYCPCARGAGINDETIPLLRCKAVAGCANNQLLEPGHAVDLMNRGIVYAPDYVINAGGIINVGVEMTENGYDEGVALEWIERIYGNLKRVFEISRAESIPTDKAARQLAQARIDEGRS